MKHHKTDIGSALPRKLLFRSREASEAMGIGKTTLYELLRAGKLKGVRIGRGLRIPVAEVERFIADQLEEK
jgi:excisionase family DNA binding protein